MSRTLPPNDQSFLFDLQFLAKNVGDDVAARRQIIQIFLSTSTEALVQMETLLLSDQTVEYRRVVHKIFPSLKVLGMHWATEAMNTISAALKNGEKPSSQMPAFLAFREKMKLCFNELQAWA